MGKIIPHPANPRATILIKGLKITGELLEAAKKVGADPTQMRRMIRIAAVSAYKAGHCDGYVRQETMRRAGKSMTTEDIEHDVQRFGEELTQLLGEELTQPLGEDDK